MVDIMQRDLRNGDLVFPMGERAVHGPALVYDNMLYTVNKYIYSGGSFYCDSANSIDTEDRNVYVYKVDRALCTRGTPERHVLTMLLCKLRQQYQLPLSRNIYEHLTSKQQLTPGHAYVSGHTARHMFIYVGKCTFMNTELVTRVGHLVIDMPVFTPHRLLVYGRPQLQLTDLAAALRANMRIDGTRVEIRDITNTVLLTAVPTRVAGDLGPVALPSGNVELWRTGSARGRRRGPRCGGRCAACAPSWATYTTPGDIGLDV